MLLVVHVVWAPVRHADECRGLHCHTEGRRDGAQHPAAAFTLDHASFRYNLLLFTQIYLILLAVDTSILSSTAHITPSV